MDPRTVEINATGSHPEATAMVATLLQLGLIKPDGKTLKEILQEVADAVGQLARLYYTDRISMQAEINLSSLGGTAVDGGVGNSSPTPPPAPPQAPSNVTPIAGSGGGGPGANYVSSGAACPNCVQAGRTGIMLTKVDGKGPVAKCSLVRRSKLPDGKYGHSGECENQVWG